MTQIIDQSRLVQIQQLLLKLKHRWHPKKW